MTDWPWEWLYWYVTVRLGRSDKQFWRMIPKIMFSLIEQDQRQRIEDAIAIGYAVKLDNPGKLRVKSAQEIIAEREAAIDAFGGW